MKFVARPTDAVPGCRSRSRRRGFTLLELLIATVVTLIMTALVAQMFQFVTEGIFNSRAMIEISDQLRNARHRLIQDLRGVTAPTVPSLDPSMNAGYFEYVEGANVANTIGGDVGGLMTITTATGNIGGVLSNTGTLTMVNTVSGDLDDILMFTTFAVDDQFVGKAGGTSGLTDTRSTRAAKSRFAEVAWSTRAVSGQPFHNLYRRIWLINGYGSWGSDYAATDQSMREDYGPLEPLATNTNQTAGVSIAVNNLGDLTMRERRSLHQPYIWPYEMLYASTATTRIMSVLSSSWTEPSGTTTVNRSVSWPATAPLLGLPTLNESTHGNFPRPMLTVGRIFANPNRVTVSLGAGNREAEDIILSDVVSFDVKAWDPGAPVFRAPLANASTTTATVTDTSLVGLIVPGDGGYGGDGLKHGSITFPRGALYRFVSSPNTAANQPVAFGAFADLNYMWLNNAGGDENVISTTSALNRYLTALGTYEDAVLRKNESPPMVRLPRPNFGFANRGRILSGWPMTPPTTTGAAADISGVTFPAVWDTWSRHYEYDGIDNDFDGFVDEGTDGLDNNNNGFIDEPPAPIDGDTNGDRVLDKAPDGFIDGNEMYAAELMSERDAPPPFDAPLRGIKVTIRVMEQDSRQVREVSTIHEFIPF